MLRQRQPTYKLIIIFISFLGKLAYAIKDPWKFGLSTARTDHFRRPKSQSNNTFLWPSINITNHKLLENMSDNNRYYLEIKIRSNLVWHLELHKVYGYVKMCYEMILFTSRPTLEEPMLFPPCSCRNLCRNSGNSC